MSHGLEIRGSKWTLAYLQNASRKWSLRVAFSATCIFLRVKILDLNPFWTMTKLLKTKCFWFILTIVTVAYVYFKMRSHLSAAVSNMDKFILKSADDH